MIKKRGSDTPERARKKHNRIYVSPGKIAGREIFFSEEDRRHLEKVLRLGNDDLVCATDGAGTEYVMRLSKEDSGIRGKIVDVKHPLRESPLSVTLVQGIPKGDLMAQVIQKAVELGVTSILPVTTGRTVVSPREERYQGKRRRWMKIIEGAVAQSGRTQIPFLGEVQSWQKSVREAPPSELKIVLLEKEPAGLEMVLRGRRRPSSLLLAVGPEGGWERREIEQLHEAGFTVAGIGPRILRTGTASLAALSIIQFLFGDLGHGGTSAMDSEKGSKAL